MIDNIIAALCVWFFGFVAVCWLALVFVSVTYFIAKCC